MIFIGFSPRLFAESIEAAMSDGFEDGYVNARSLTGAKRAERRKAPPGGVPSRRRNDLPGEALGPDPYGPGMCVLDGLSPAKRHHRMMSTKELCVL